MIILWNDNDEKKEEFKVNFLWLHTIGTHEHKMTFMNTLWSIHLQKENNVDSWCKWNHNDLWICFIFTLNSHDLDLGGIPYSIFGVVCKDYIEMTKKFKNFKMNWDTLCFKSFEHHMFFKKNCFECDLIII